VRLFYFAHAFNLPHDRLCPLKRPFSHLLGTVGMLLVMLLWLSLLNPPEADHLVDSLAGSQHEYKIVLGAALLSTVFSFIAAIRGFKWWYVGLPCHRERWHFLLTASRPRRRSAIFGRPCFP
jgi:hypothetical protein